MNDRTATGSTSLYSRELIEKTRQLWSSSPGIEISDEEAISIIENITGFFDYLHSLDERYNSDDDLDEKLDFSGHAMQDGGL